MEVVRDRRRQLHHHLLHREPRPDGRAHRRFDHRRPGADADRQGIPDHAQRLDRGAARDRRRDRRLQRAVRRQPGRRPPGRHRDEPARLALLGACLQGHRLPDRQGRGQARRRLHAGRARQRHHRRRDAGLVRADDRLRRHQDPALCLREVPRRRAAPDHRDEIGRRSHGHRPHLCRKAAEGAARAGDRPDRPRRDRDSRPGEGDDKNAIKRAIGTPTPDRCAWSPRPSGSGSATDEVHAICKIDPWFLAQIEEIVAMEARIRRTACRTTPTNAAAAQGDGLLRCAPRLADRQAGKEVAKARRASGRAPGLQAHRHLRRRIRLADAYMYSTYETPFGRQPACEARPPTAKRS
jgi:hypothetical protein